MHMVSFRILSVIALAFVLSGFLLSQISLVSAAPVNITLSTVVDYNFSRADLIVSELFINNTGYSRTVFANRTDGTPGWVDLYYISPYAIVKNIGLLSAPASHTRITVYDATLGTYTSLALSTPRLRPGAQTLVLFPYSFEIAEGMNHTVHGGADSFGVVAESNEFNNELSELFYVF